MHNVLFFAMLFLQLFDFFLLFESLPSTLTLFDMRGAIWPPFQIIGQNEKLVRAKGLGYWDYYHNLVTHVS